jgi:Zn-dependent protease
MNKYIKKFKYIKLFEIQGVPINIHFSLSIILLLMFIGGISEPSLILGGVCFWGIMLAHELGHMYVATKLRLNTLKINLYLFHGLCFYEAAETEYENCLVSWGGVIAQAALFVPCLIIYNYFGDHLAWYLSVPLILFGYFNAMFAAINLTPSKWLDGGSCWRIIPLKIQRYKCKKDMKIKLKSKSISTEKIVDAAIKKAQNK